MTYRIQKADITFNPPIYYCKKASKPFTLDGDIDKVFWNDAEYTSDFVDIEGDIRGKPRCLTRAKMLWDDNNLYFAAELWGDEIWAHVKERDAVIFQDNDFEIFIDPDSDTHHYYEFEINALNTVWDLFLTKPYRDHGIPLNGWDIKGLRSAVKINGALNDPTADNKRWTLEVVMPFEALKEANTYKKRPEKGDYWRINFSRVQWQVDVMDGKYVKKMHPITGESLPEDNWVWSPTGVVNMHYPELWGFVFFCEDKEGYPIPDHEYVKWELRQLYYAQHGHFNEKGCFTADLKKLLQGRKLGLDICIEVTKSNFEMYCLTQDGSQEIAILGDGKIIIR
ncbi:carbohydrate-binding family 9-like protein [Vallitalea okinawensis]|uniref:carbohydrate-binding family 9-like protein n=1 Tax=Vallitalea okinawensis TaxID=2078660 RepID=UPI000CFAE4BF|nr:carbohydrate-binding family 9-like protein [Vallitalea okinawensis]